jgi:hypothetical protein
MSAVIFSDAHLTMSDPYGLRPFREKALRAALEAGAKTDMIVDAGDSENQRYFDAELMAWQTSIFTECLGKRITDYVRVLGNHDGSSREISPFHTFLNGARCYGKGPTIAGREAKQIGRFLFRGWVSNETLQSNSFLADYLVTHLRVKEWVFNSSERAYLLEELEALPFCKIFTGDLHTPKESLSGKVVSIGTLCPSSFADKDIRANYIKFDEDHNEFERVWLDYPIFREIKIYEDVEFEPNSEYVNGNIVRLKFIGDHTFVNDKTIRQRWISKIWLMEPHAVPDPEWEQTNGGDIAVQEEISIEEEIKQAAKQQQWPEGVENVALRS